ncbi:penicillin-binding transpeptidase domain-containing protein [Lactococcus termiticola]|uniref:Penicillin-binding protein 2B n=1 Tax=Lactococcus termiticola TaxID=2169526 RepID=A0A2R5HI95_9LACT|nr:penicillin-binding transpeptidase domain-containing protein [Lactococcus termiticola]GBG95998.1 penicillin-binding protein 2B [Lactococcus termiticola]
MEEKQSRRERRPEQKKQMNNPHKVRANRVKLLFFIIAILFLILIGKLYSMQIHNQAFYQKQFTGGASTLKIVQGAPRGNIYDATGKPLAMTAPSQAILYTRGNQVTADGMRAVADQLSTMIPSDLVNGKLTERDKKDYYLADKANLKKTYQLLSDKELKDKNGNQLTQAKIYDLELDKVTDADINFNDQQTFAAKLFKEMNGTSLYNTTTIAAGNITPEQQAAIGEREGSLPGISIGTSWDRSYADNALTSLLGTVTSQKTGIPSNLLDKYLEQGYQRNDRVGTAYLEESYEKYLQGTHEISKVETDKTGNITGTKVTQAGKQGDSLKLTVNLDFQNGVDNILQTELNKMLGEGFGQYNTGAYAVVMDAKTGGILALSGLDRDANTGETKKDTNATFQSVFPPGSVVKPATLTAGWKSGAISGNQVLDDQPIIFGDSSPIESWFTNGALPITAVQALEYSSNTYMVQVALRMLGQPYTAHMTLNDDKAKVDQVYNQLRSAYASYGLGTSTGFDVPGESTGYITPTKDANANISNLLFEAFGQFDNYTPLQLATYATTLANNGNRLAPHIVDSIHDTNATGGLGKSVQTVQPKVEGKVDISSENMDVIQQGLYQVVHANDMLEGHYGATGYYMRQAPVSVSAKTGTSQTNVVTPSGALQTVTVNNVVAYAPTNNPQISVGIMIPNTTVKDGGVTTEMAQYVTNDIVSLYQQMYGFK